jgi:3-deoxy-D-manno-octulosonic-acid transferase
MRWLAGRKRQAKRRINSRGRRPRKRRIMADALPMTLRVYRSLSSAAAPLIPAVIRQRLKHGKEDPERIGERRGLSRDVRPVGPLVWIHGASVGEVLAVASLIERLRALNLRILLTSGTVTSAAIVARRFPPDIIHQYVPYDSPRFVARFLDHWRPSLALFIESDLWPNLILSSAARRLPMVLINGRMSPRSFPRWRRVSATISALLGRFDICLAQSRVDAERFSALGCANVVTTGNLKLDVPAPPADAQKLERLMLATRGRPVIVAASTHPGEEEILLQAHRTLSGFFPGLLTVIVPRHPDRGPAIALTVATSGLAGALRSRDELPKAATEVYIADTLGELGLFYRLAPIVFMGGSLVRHGGQNPIEAIKLGAATVHGPHVFNFADVYEALDSSGGARRADDLEALVKQLGQLLADPDACNTVNAAGSRVVDELGGALERTLTALEPYLLQLRLEMGAADA